MFSIHAEMQSLDYIKSNYSMSLYFSNHIYLLSAQCPNSHGWVKSCSSAIPSVEVFLLRARLLLMLTLSHPHAQKKYEIDFSQRAGFNQAFEMHAITHTGICSHILHFPLVHFAWYPFFYRINSCEFNEAAVINMISSFNKDLFPIGAHIF